jgi:hypothetical protein
MESGIKRTQKDYTLAFKLVNLFASAILTAHIPHRGMRKQTLARDQPYSVR